MGPTAQAQHVVSLIRIFRGQRVMVGSDLAALYGVAAKALVQAVKRNLDRFPADFFFRLTEQEVRVLRSQIVTLDSKRPAGRGKYAKYIPYAFTEQGVATTGNSRSG